MSEPERASAAELVEQARQNALARQAERAAVQAATPPDYQEDVVWQAQRAMNLLIQACQDIVTRYSERGTWYVVPDPYTLGGAGGIMHAGRYQVVGPLQAQLDKTLQTFAEIDALIDAHRRRLLSGEPDDVARQEE